LHVFRHSAILRGLWLLKNDFFCLNYPLHFVVVETPNMFIPCIYYTQ